MSSKSIPIPIPSLSRASARGSRSRSRSRSVAFAAVAALAVLVGCSGETPRATGTVSPTVDASAASAADQPFAKMDFSTVSDHWPTAIGEARAAQRWDAHADARKSGAAADADPRDALELKMNRALLEQAFTAGSGFLVNWQLPEGNFRYMYDWVERTWVEDDHQVRQAGSLWGIGTCHRFRPTEATKKVLDLGLKFWFENTVEGPEPGTLMMKYPGNPRIDSGSVALVVLALVEYLKTDAPMDAAYRAELEEKLDGYLAFLKFLQLPNGHIAKYYDHQRSKRAKNFSPYYDGESLLAMSKAARQLDKKELVPTIERAARAMAETYTIPAWKKDRDSKDTKGFFQWGSMAFAEYHQAQWKDYELFGDVALSLGYWMIHTHETLIRRRNHAYAIEGLIAGWRVANARGDTAAQADLLYVLDRSLHKLSQWQIGGPLAGKNKWLVANNTDDPMAQGGVMNARKPSGRDVKKDVSHQLRIDVTQHQMHAVTMSLEHVYKQ